MKPVKETRRSHLQRLLQGYASQKQFAQAVNLSPAHVSQMITGVREVGDQVARRIETALGLSVGFLDNDPQANAPLPPDKMRLLQELPSDQLKLLMDYAQLSPRHREMVRETAAAYAFLEHKQHEE